MDLRELLRVMSLSAAMLYAAHFLGYLTRVLFARVLTTEEYGMFYALIGFFMFFAVFRSFGMSPTLIHFIPKYRSEGQKLRYMLWITFLFQVLVGVVAFLLFFGLSGQIAEYIFHDPGVTFLVQIHAITFVLIGFARYFHSILRGMQRHMLSAAYDTVRLFFVLACTSVLLLLGKFTLTALVLVWMFSYLFIILVYQPFLIPLYRKTRSVSAEKFPRIRKELIGYAVPLMLGIAADIILSRSDVVLLTFFRGVSEVALYEIAHPASQLLLLFVSAFSFVVFPVVSKLHYSKNQQRIRDLFSGAYNAGLYLVAPVFVMLMVYPEIVIRLIFGEKYLAAAPALQIFTAGTLFLVFAQINFNILQGVGEVKRRTRILYFVAIFNIVLDIAAIIYFGYIGAIVVTSVSFAIMWFLSYRACIQHLELDLRIRAMGKIILSAALFAAIVVIMKNSISGIPVFLEAGLIGAISAGVYFIFGTLVLKVIDPKILMRLLRSRRK